LKHKNKTTYKFDTRKASKEFHMAYDLAKAVKDVGFINVDMTISWDMLKKVTPEGTPKIIDLGIDLAFADTSYCIGLDADAKTGEHLTLVHDKNNNAYRVRYSGGILEKPFLLMVPEDDIIASICSLMAATIEYRGN